MSDGSTPATPAEVRALAEDPRLAKLGRYVPLLSMLRALRDDEVGPYRIPAGSTLFLGPFVTHRRLNLRENPEGFDPERSPDVRPKAMAEKLYTRLRTAYDRRPARGRDATRKGAEAE